MKILCIYDKSGPKYHRILLPVFLMQGVEILTNYKIDEEQLPGVDIVFFNRMIPRTTIQGVLDLKIKYGFKLVIDFDDYWILGRDHLLYEQYNNHMASEVMAAFITESDAVTVTHDRLAEKVYPLNKNVHILPNAIPQFDQFLCKKIPDDKLRLFWCGGVTHRKDLEIIKRPLQLIKRDKVKFVIGGFEHKNPEWKAMAKAFTCNSSYNTEVIESLPVDKYYHIYAKCDVSLVPLLPTKFNGLKSNLKVLESANIGAPVIVSRVDPYLGFPDDIVNYVDNYASWYQQINKLIKNPALVKEQGRCLKEYCEKEFNFEAVNKKRKQLFDAVTQSEQAGSTEAGTG